MNIRPLSAELHEKAVNELNERKETVEEDLNYIKSWLLEQSHLCARTDDQWLLAFLRGSKFNRDKTKEKLDMFYTMRTLLPEFYKNRDPLLPEMQEILELGVYLPLLMAAPNGERIILTRYDYDHSKIDTDMVLKIFTCIYDILMVEDDNFVVAGLQSITDFKKGSMPLYVKFQPAQIKKLAKCLQESYPIRVKGLNFINVPSYFKLVYNIFKGALTKKLKDRMSVAKDETLRDTIPTSILPEDYGGDGESVEALTEYWKKKIESYRSWFLEDEKYCSDESKRVGSPKTVENVFGIDGSFRLVIMCNKTMQLLFR